MYTSHRRIQGGRRGRGPPIGGKKKKRKKTRGKRREKKGENEKEKEMKKKKRKEKRKKRRRIIRNKEEGMEESKGFQMPWSLLWKNCLALRARMTKWRGGDWDWKWVGVL